ncbi:hypothetical protein PsYK624_040750 [Phanerochaete sordida]|uniref:DUF6533 domain-containing protein n=1 Tax=Phanerochaete sordida TaxID=48140 RepID=A0A9P3G4K6_9APHY|nr:hypothetical protein PsYK624_040750 [Phanerochaete sordida]
MDTPSTTLRTQFFLQTALTLSAVVVLLYDHIITFDIEYRIIWRRPWRKASAIFLMTRYVAFFALCVDASNVIYGLSHDQYTDGKPLSLLSYNRHLRLFAQACRHFTLYRQIAIGVVQFIVAANQFLRVYALYGLDRRVAAVIVFTATTVVAIGAWSITMQKEHDAATGCHPMLSNETANRLAIVWVALFAYDVLIFALMLMKAAKDRAQLVPTERGGLVTIVYRDGAIYFA